MFSSKSMPFETISALCLTLRVHANPRRGIPLSLFFANSSSAFALCNFPPSGKHGIYLIKAERSKLFHFLFQCGFNVLCKLVPVEGILRNPYKRNRMLFCC